MQTKSKSRILRFECPHCGGSEICEAMEAMSYQDFGGVRVGDDGEFVEAIEEGSVDFDTSGGEITAYRCAGQGCFADLTNPDGTVIDTQADLVKYLLTLPCNGAPRPVDRGPEGAD